MAVKSGKEKRAYEKWRHYSAATGRPLMVSGREAEEAFAKVREFNERGMAATAMAAQLDVSASIIRQMINGVRTPRTAHDTHPPTPVTQLWRSTYELIMNKLQYEEPPTETLGGARTDPTGSRRRLRALAAIGFPTRTISVLMGKPVSWAGHQLTGYAGGTYVFASTHRHIAALYDKLCAADPADYGVSAYGRARAIKTALRNGYAPPSCWDVDTIDNPAAIAEWTGACGTEIGYAIHERDNIPVCNPCLDAIKVFALVPARLRAARIEAGLSRLALSQATGVHQRTIRNYEEGTSAPTGNRLQALAQAVGVDVADLSDWTVPTPEQLAARRPFRGELLTERMTELGYTQKSLERSAGLSGGAVNHWLSGRSQPRPDLLERVARVLDAEPADFYTRPQEG